MAARSPPLPSFPARAAHVPSASNGALDPGQIAWLAALPCALLTLAGILVLGAPLGHAFLGPRPVTFWTPVQPIPEPVEHGRFLIALLGPPLLAAIVLASVGRRPRLPARTADRLVLASQVLLLAFCALCLAAQNDILFNTDSTYWERTRFFTLPTLVAAALLAALPFALLRRSAVLERLRGWAGDTRARTVVGVGAAVLMTVVFVLSTVNTEATIATANPAVAGHVLWSLDETFAILNGRTPLVDFHAQYGQLWPYVAALTMTLLGTTIGVYTVTMATISGLALVALYATLRRLVRSSLLALALYLPILASSFFMKLGPLENRYGAGSLISLWPIRYGGVYLLAWATARHVDGAAPRRGWLLFAAAGLVVLNNPEFGLPVFGATLVALPCAAPPRSWRAGARLLGEAAAGLAAATALVIALALVRSGALPHFGLLFEFSRLYAIDGWAMIPMPRFGLHLVVFLTFSATLVLAAVRVARGAEDRLLTALLAWAGAFGLGASAYFAGRSHPQVLIDLFSTWAFALALLVVVVARDLSARGWRRPGLAQLAVLFGFGLMACSLAQTPTPWSQISRLRAGDAKLPFKQAEAVALVRRTTHPGEHVAILISLSHRVAYDAGVVNVSPYASIESMPTHQQLSDVIALMRSQHVRKLYTSSRFMFPEESTTIQRAGFATVTQDGDATELIDRGSG
ncbi:MAG TPA: hypothetical protein VE972_12045 [Conexibacter sp.]|nr:hypothetical protein [Conexibacter sp.]